MAYVDVMRPKSTVLPRRSTTVGNGGATWRVLQQKHLTTKLFQAYRVRETGNSVVANRETLEEWLDAGNEAYLMLLVDPRTGKSFEYTISDNVLHLAEDAFNWVSLDVDIWAVRNVDAGV
mgnify:CR=1 FL=1